MPVTVILLRIKNSLRWDPINPAAPVTKAFTSTPLVGLSLCHDFKWPLVEIKSISITILDPSHNMLGKSFEIVEILKPVK
jgi:hypothetical protein